MTYKNKLSPWCIIRPLPNMRYRFIARFRRRADAEGHLHILRRNNPIASYEIIFDMTPEPLNSKAKQELSQSDEMESKGL